MHPNTSPPRTQKQKQTRWRQSRAVDGILLRPAPYFTYINKHFKGALLDACNADGNLVRCFFASIPHSKQQQNPKHKHKHNQKQQNNKKTNIKVMYMALGELSRLVDAVFRPSDGARHSVDELEAALAFINEV